MGIIEQLEKRKKLLSYLNSPSSEEVYTPITLVEEMLDKLPQEIWKNPDLLWCDPCSKSGVFMLEVIIRLMKHLPIQDETLRYNHIINNMVKAYVNVEGNKWIVSKMMYGSTSKARRVEVLKDINKIKIEEMPKFDVVVGNPPFQETIEGRRKAQFVNLWSKFILLSEKIVKSNGYIALITPPSWLSGSSLGMYGKGPNLLNDFFRKYYTKYVNLDCNKYFNVGSSFSYFITILQDNIDNDTIFEKNNKKFSINLNNYDNLPTNLNETTISILNKLNNYNSSYILFDRTDYFGSGIGEKSASKEKREKLSLEKNETFKYPIFHTQKTTYYTNEKHTYLGIPKIIISLSGNYVPFYDKKGEYAFTKMCFFILENKNNNLDEIYKLLINPLFKWIINTLKWSGFINAKVLQRLPSISGDPYKYFNLTQEEINYIESQVK